MSPAAAEHLIGIDVGGTKVAGGIVRISDGALLRRLSIPTGASRGGRAVLDDALALAQALLKSADGMGIAIGGIGVGVCELVDRNGRVTSGHTVAWQGIDVRAAFDELAPAVVEADIRAHALAEARFGAGRRYETYAYVSVGTGISSCLVQAGRPYAGANGNALVLASSPLTTTCSVCGTVLRPVLEESAAGPALALRYSEATDQLVTQAEPVLAAAAAGDPIACDIVRTAGEALGVSVAFLVNILDPEAVVVGGGLGVAGGLYWTSFVASTRTHIWSDGSRNVPILSSQVGVDAGVIGAAMRVTHSIKSAPREGGGNESDAGDQV